ncbi:MAG: hypothetical protein P4L41_11170 [Flavipsychrobacter sp.]|nr:hypothetical protein [Flavipsychrobacter sp.]
MSPNVIFNFHKKGIYSIAQLSHLFRPRRRRRHPQVSTNYLWELKALAITEQKTFVLYPPDVKETAVSIYLGFEGLPEWMAVVVIPVLSYLMRMDIFQADVKKSQQYGYHWLPNIKSYS